MFDMSWGEVMLIGGVALIVIGPKDLPKALRTVGQITGKMRRMAGEFQAQFNEAIREAEFEEIRREVDGVRKSTSTMGPVFNPVQTIRDEIKGVVDGRVETKTTPSPTQPLANVAAQLAENESAAPDGAANSISIAQPAVPPVEALPDLPPRPKPVPPEAAPSSADPLAPAPTTQPDPAR